MSCEKFFCVTNKENIIDEDIYRSIDIIDIDIEIETHTYRDKKTLSTA